MKKWIIALVLGLLLGFIIGFSFGVTTTLKQSIYASSVIFDIELKDEVKGIIQQFPALMQRITDDDKDKLGLQKLNETLTKSVDLKYGDTWKTQ